MKASRELDALVAEKVMRLNVVHEVWNDGKSHGYSIGEPDYCYTADEPSGYLSNPLPQYSTDISAAWEVVEKIAVGGEPTVMQVYGPLADGYKVTLIWEHHDGPIEGPSVIADTAPLAICLAALKVMGVDVSKGINYERR